ncbi:unnamed protein product [Trichobilharzia szidati]|nr:unnamed protein product [Trichobilharzia szidati]
MPNLKGSIENLRRQLRALRFNYEVNFQGMILGQSSAFVEFYRHLLCDYNTQLTSHLVERGFGMLGTNDNKFMEVFYRILRDVITYRPPVTLTQFFMNNFAERKIEMATTVALLIGSLIKRSFTTSSISSRGKTSSLQTNQRHHRIPSSRSNYQSTVTTSTTTNAIPTSQIPLILPTTAYHRSVVEKNVDITPIVSTTNHVIHSNDKDYTTYGDIPNNENEQAKENGERSALCEFPQESNNRCGLMNRSNGKITSLSKTSCSYGDTNTRGECDHQLPTSTLKMYTANCYHYYYYVTTVPSNGARSRSISNNRISYTSAFPPAKSSFNTDDLLHNSKQFKKDYTHGLSTTTVTSTGGPAITPTSTLLPRHPNIQSINHHHCYPSNESSAYINPESIHNIINSLDQLSDKVDCMLERMNKLEDKLANVDIDCNMYNRSKTYDGGGGGGGGGRTYDMNRRNLNVGDLHSSDSIVECNSSVFPNRKGEQKNPLPIINLPNSLSATPVTSILENTLNEAQWTSTIGTATTVSLMTTATKTTTTSNTCYMRPICPERYLFNDTNNELSESSYLRPKYSFELTQANIQDIGSNNPSVLCKNIAEKEQQRISQASPIHQNPSCISSSSSNNNQPIRIAPTTFNPLYESYNFNENCCELHNRPETSESMHVMKYNDSLRTVNQSSNSPVVMSTSLMNLDTKSDVTVCCPTSTGRNAINPLHGGNYAHRSSPTDCSVTCETADAMDCNHLKVTPSISFNVLNSKLDRTKIANTEKVQKSYLAQVERITNMLAETQTLLQERPSKINELINGNNNRSNNNNDNNNVSKNNTSAVVLKA